jgi:hypothetical protein
VGYRIEVFESGKLGFVVAGVGPVPSGAVERGLPPRVGKYHPMLLVDANGGEAGPGGTVGVALPFFLGMFETIS